MPEKSLVYCEDAQICEFQDTAIEFLGEVLGLPAEDCLFLSDESDLDDFSSMQMPEGVPAATSWDSWVTGRVQAHYGITLTTTRINLVLLFHWIEREKKDVRH